MVEMVAMVVVMELYFTLKRFKIALLGPELCEGPSVSDLVEYRAIY